ncbi:S46 family peptidase [Larkinella terrae]|uniref:Dipeptidyl-peptidase n=1 Tax=Larkinella terrae TaxID=2025311 RepID=A0A7K0EGA2_9BACT|nr:S46 family peptidase [Larkinella terrae]MRS60795.1 S46 family peptidase [Larkinella terrae]
MRLLFVALFLVKTVFVSAQATLNPDTVKAGQFDMGKMWTFDTPPQEYFQKTYGFTPDQKWFDEVRLSSLRFADYCSASFVSASGLVMTNHHCARESGTGVQRKGENLNATGFFAKTLAEERKVENLYVDQLLKIEDITTRVQASMSSGKTEAEQLQLREREFASIKQEFGNQPEWKGLELQTITFYNGGRYALYGFKRYNDVRLVLMPELDLGFFGGDPDNFTYPRYALDFSFFRVYDNGKPLKTTHFFKFNPNGIREGEPVFVTGNPGSTERLKTVAELEFDRDLKIPYILQLLRNRADALQVYNAKAKSDSIQNEIFSFENSLKAYGGQLEGLRDPYLIARKGAFEQQFKADAQRLEGGRGQGRLSTGSGKKTETANGSASGATGSRFDVNLKLWDNIASNVSELRKYYKDNTYLSPSELSRGDLLVFAHLLVTYADVARQNPGRAEQVKELLQTPKLTDRALEEAYLAAHLSEAQAALGNDDPYVKAALNGKSPKEAAAYLMNNTKMNDQGYINDLVTKGPAAISGDNDPLLALARISVPRYQEASAATKAIAGRQTVLRSNLGRLLYEVYGTGIPPDATFSLRINDGIVKGFPYNGTMAPYQTTFSGLYDRYYSFNGKFPWSLPKRWLNPPAELLRQPMCFVSTNDIIGGNSGSPLINKNREAVGLAFDGNMESLPGSFIFVPDKNRTVSVNTGAIVASMRYIYKAERLVKELVGK